MTEDTSPPPSPQPAIDKESDREGRPGFIADLGFTLVVPWLVLWRFELPNGPSRSMWTGWWPVIVLVALLGVALAIGVAQRRPKGFLPYNVRWALLAVTLVLPAWIAISLADSRTVPTSFAAAAARARADLGSSSGTGSAAQDVQDAIASSEKLAERLEQAESKGANIPQKPIPGAEGLDPESRKTFEQAHALADAIDRGDPLPSEAQDETADDEADKAKVMGALLVLAAVLLAPMLGLSVELVFTLLQGLVAAGSLTFGNVVRLVATLAASTNPDGTFNEAKVRENIERYEEVGRSVDILIEAAEKSGANVDQSQLGQLRRGGGASRKAPVDLDRARADCRKNVADDRQNPDLETLMSERCQQLNERQIRELAAELKRGDLR